MKYNIGEGKGFLIKSVKVSYSYDGRGYIQHMKISYDDRKGQVINSYDEHISIQANDVMISLHDNHLPKAIRSLRIEVTGILDKRMDLFHLKRIPEELLPIYRSLRVNAKRFYANEREISEVMYNIREDMASLPTYTE
jgi:hypothetical protein